MLEWTLIVRPFVRSLVCSFRSMDTHPDLASILQHDFCQRFSLFIFDVPTTTTTTWQFMYHIYMKYDYLPASINQMLFIHPSLVELLLLCKTMFTYFFTALFCLNKPEIFICRIFCCRHYHVGNSNLKQNVTQAGGHTRELKILLMTNIYTIDNEHVDYFSCKPLKCQRTILSRWDNKTNFYILCQN